MGPGIKLRSLRSLRNHDNDDDKNVTILNIQPIKNKRFLFL